MAQFSEIIARRRLASQLVADLSSGLSVLLTGMPGAGRSHMIRLICRELRLAGVPVLAVRGSRMLVERPLSTLSLIDTGQEGSEPLPKGSSLAQASAWFGSLLEAGKTVLAIDDADEVDPVSAAVIVDACATRKTPMLLASNRHTTPGEVMAKLIEAGQPGVSVEIANLPFEDITYLINGLLDGVVEADTASRIATLSGGLPRLIEAIVRLGRRDGRLIRRDGAWVGTTNLWNPGLRFALLPLLHGLDHEDLAALTRLTRSEGLSRDTAGELVEPARLYKLAQRGLVNLHHLSPAVGVHVYPSALAEMLRRDGGWSVQAEPYSVASTIDLGHWPASVLGMEASAITDRMNSYCQSEVAGFWAVWNANRSAENAIPLLTALLGARAHDERIPVIFDKTEPSEVPEEILNMAALEGEYHAVARRDLAGALDYLTNFAKQYPQFDSIMRGHQAHLIMILDRLPSPELLKLPKNLAPLDAEMLVVARAEAQVAQGLVFDAAATLATVNPERRRAAILKQVLDIHVLMLEQDIAMGVEVAVRRLWEAVVAGDIRTLSAWAYVAGLGMCLLGRFDELKSIVEIIYRLGDASVYQNHYRVGLYMLGSYVSSWEGLTSYSNNLVQQAKALAVGTGPMPGMRANLSLLPGTENAPDMAWEEVDDLLDRGFLVSAVFHAITAAETDPTSPTAKRLLELCAKFQGPVLPAMARYVATLVARDSTLYEATVSELRKSCGALVTTRAIISWALLLREKGDLEGWVEKAQAAWQESTAMSDPASGLFRRLTEAVDLTIREAEVAHYAVLGLSAQEIASKTGISTRTVETHLHFVYRKTGVSSRADLRQLTQTWLVLPTED